MEAVITIYVPPRVSQTEKDFLDVNIDKMKKRHPNVEMFYVEDPARNKAEMEVFFNPYFYNDYTEPKK